MSIVKLMTGVMMMYGTINGEKNKSLILIMVLYKLFFQPSHDFKLYSMSMYKYVHPHYKQMIN